MMHAVAYALLILQSQDPLKHRMRRRVLSHTPARIDRKRNGQIRVAHQLGNLKRRRAVNQLLRGEGMAQVVHRQHTDFRPSHRALENRVVMLSLHWAPFQIAKNVTMD